ncbi:hypothetical protein EN816_00650 [Mesorhizobium sp. M8A.F.Ca.ET.173.01.1.1]|nr:hypothetical protein EN816_00650 [Mesorhizobium sp. M8A.F.Ca.ET.173.01.1.1]
MKMTEAELNEKIAALGDVSDEQRNSIVCALIGHSNIVTTFFGYVYCARCTDQIGDSLGSYYNNPDVVIVGHDCDICRANAKRLRWQDTVHAPDPFAATEAEPA